MHSEARKIGRKLGIQISIHGEKLEKLTEFIQPNAICLSITMFNDLFIICEPYLIKCVL